MDYNKLKIILRNDFNLKIRPLYLKDKCECCNSTEDLHCHHIKPFILILEEVLNKTGIGLKNEYTDTEVYIIKSCMINEQLNEEYKTLCKNCHIEEHKENGKYVTEKGKENRASRLIECNRNKKEKRLRKCYSHEKEQMLLDFIEKYKNVEFDKETLGELIKIVNIGRTTDKKDKNTTIIKGKKGVNDALALSNIELRVGAKQKKVKGKLVRVYYFE